MLPESDRLRVSNGGKPVIENDLLKFHGGILPNGRSTFFYRDLPLREKLDELETSFRQYSAYCLSVSHAQDYKEVSGSRKSPDRILAIVFALLVIAVVLMTLFTSGNTSKSLDPSTPAGTVQSYLTAVLKGDYELAAQFISLESSCDVQDLNRVYTMDTARVDLVKTEVDGDHAQVWVKVNYPSDAPFEAIRMEDHTFRLVRVNGDWLLSGIPWPLYDCGAITK